MLPARRSSRIALLLGVLSTSCPGRGGQLAPANDKAVGPVASAPKVSDAACIWKLPTPETASDAQLLAMIAACVGRTPALNLTRFAVSDTEIVARVVDKADAFTALAWIEQRADELRILALKTAAPDTGFPPYTFRKETLHGESVIVEGMTMGCWETFLHWPELPPEPEIGISLPELRPRTADECPRRVERIWLRRGRMLLNIGAYAVEGEQRVDATTTREFSSKVSFDGELVHVVDDAVWRAWGPPNFQTMDIDVALPVVAEASSRFERLYRFEGGALVEISGRVAVPKLRSTAGRHQPFKRFEPCGPLPRAPKR